MRVLFIGRTDQFDGKSSLTNLAMSLMGLMLKRDPEMQVTWTVPTGTPDDLIAANLLAPLGEAAQRVKVVKCQATFGGRLLGYFLSEPLYHLLAQTKTTTPYDVILCNQPALMPLYRTLLRNKYQAARYNVSTPIVGWQLWVASDRIRKTMEEYVNSDEDILAESMGSMAADQNVWESSFMLDDHLQTVRKWLSPAAIRHIRDTSVMVSEGVDVEGVRKVALQARLDRAADGGMPGLFWGARLANQKKPRTTFPLMREVVGQMEGRVYPLVSTSTAEGGGQGQWAKGNFPDLNVRFDQSRSQFVMNMRQGDVFMSNSPYESYGIGWLEMLAAGMLGVFERAFWTDMLLPDWYPFVTEDPKEQVQMAVALLRDWPNGPLWQEYVPKVRQWLDEEHDERVQAERFLEVLHKAYRQGMEEDEPLARSSIGDVAAQAAEALWDGSTPIPEEDVFAKMQELSDANRDWGKKGDMITRFYLRRCLQLRGWKDTCQSSEVEFVKEEA